MLESMMPGLGLIGMRVVHFASTAQVAGIFIFLLFVESPALGQLREPTPPTIAAFRKRLLQWAWFSLAISVASGVAWLLLLAVNITDSSVTRAIADGTVRTLLTSTQIGHAWQARLVLTVILAALLLRLRLNAHWNWLQRFVAVVVAASFLGALALAGHGGATPGLLGDFHVAGDMMHLFAAGAWIGGLLPLRLLLSSTEQMPGAVGATIAHAATLRFSTLGTVAVVTLAITGLFNTWVLVGSVRGLVASAYGALLLVKIAFFLAMLAVAAFNRMRLSQRLAMSSEFRARIDALRRLKRNCLVETALGLAIIVDVGVLGTIYHGTHG
jgi:putative copper resistance protein D